MPPSNPPAPPAATHSTTLANSSSTKPQPSHPPDPLQPVLLHSLLAHADVAWCAAWNPTLPLLATCSSDRTVKLHRYRFSPPPPSHGHRPPRLHLETVETIPTGHARSVRSLAWSPSGRTLATASFDSTVGIWARVQDVIAHAGQMHDDGQDDDGGGGGAGGLVTDGGEGGATTESGGAEWDCIGTLEGHDAECKDVAFSRSGNVLASCSRDKSVWIWEVQPDADFECVSVQMEHSQDVKSLCFHPHDDALLASASYDDTVKLYRDDPSDDWFCCQTVRAHDSTVWGLAFNPGARKVGGRGKGGGGGGEGEQPTRAAAPPSSSSSLERSGRFLATCSDDATVKVWEREWYEEGEAAAADGDDDDDGEEGAAVAEAQPRRGDMRRRNRKYRDRYRLAQTLRGEHARAVYCVAWSEERPGSYSSSSASSSSSSSSAVDAWGRIASGGADGSIVIWGAGPAPPSPSDTPDDDDASDAPPPPIRLTRLCTIRRAHGDSAPDVHRLAWAPARLAPRAGAPPVGGFPDDVATQARGMGGVARIEELAAGGSEEEEGEGEREEDEWRRNTLASVAEDGSVRVWYVPPLAAATAAAAGGGVGAGA